MIVFRNQIYLALLLLVLPLSALAQDLDPRAYARVPINMTFFGVGFGYTYGNVLLDPSLPLKDLEADMESPILGVGHTMDLFGFTTQVYATLPYAWAQISGKLNGVDESRTRSGLGDMRLFSLICIIFIRNYKKFL